jgi:hypothetical protein
MNEPPAVVERYRAIYSRYLDLGSYAAVGRELGVTGDRIGQICRKWERMQLREKLRRRQQGEK